MGDEQEPRSPGGMDAGWEWSRWERTINAPRAAVEQAVLAAIENTDVYIAECEARTIDFVSYHVRVLVSNKSTGCTFAVRSSASQTLLQYAYNLDPPMVEPEITRRFMWSFVRRMEQAGIPLFENANDAVLHQRRVPIGETLVTYTPKKMRRAKASNPDTFLKIKKLVAYREQLIKESKPLPSRTAACRNIQPKIDSDTVKAHAPLLWAGWDTPDYVWKDEDYIENTDYSDY
jgi:hypothetical protein